MPKGGAGSFVIQSSLLDIGYSSGLNEPRKGISNVEERMTHAQERNAGTGEGPRCRFHHGGHRVYGGQRQTPDRAQRPGLRRFCAALPSRPVSCRKPRRSADFADRQRGRGLTTEDTEFMEGRGRPPTARSALDCGASAPLCHLVQSAAGNPEGPQMTQMGWGRELMGDEGSVPRCGQRAYGASARGSASPVALFRLEWLKK